MSRIFISHSSSDNTRAIALRDWLVDEGWDDLLPKRLGFDVATVRAGLAGLHHAIA